MKTSIKSIIALAVTAVVLTGSTLTVNASEPKTTTVLSSVKKVTKIDVAGNVELILVQSTDESVKVHDNYFANNALVQQKDGELRISSFSKEKLTVVAYVNTLTEITASGDATVKTVGKFSTLSLDVILSDNATADLNTNTINLNTNLSNASSLNLAGSTEEYNAKMGNFAKVSLAKFAATSTNIQSKSIVVAQVAKVTLPNEAEFLSL